MNCKLKFVIMQEDIKTQFLLMRASICVRSYHHFHISRLQIVIMDIHSPVLLCGGLLLKVAITAFLIAWSSL